MTFQSHEHRGRSVRLPLVVALVTFAAFLPALNNGFVSWDDQKNFLENPHYRGLGWTQLSWDVDHLFLSRVSTGRFE